MISRESHSVLPASVRKVEDDCIIKLLWRWAFVFESGGCVCDKKKDVDCCVLFKGHSKTPVFFCFFFN